MFSSFFISCLNTKVRAFATRQLEIKISHPKKQLARDPEIAHKKYDSDSMSAKSIRVFKWFLNSSFYLITAYVKLPGWGIEIR